MDKIPAAEEFYDKSKHDSILDIMTDFAKLHVKAALKEALEAFQKSIEIIDNQIIKLKENEN